MPFITGWLWWSVAALRIFVSTFVFKGPFGLMLYCTSHRPFFKPDYTWMNYYLPWVLTPFFGHTPETYYSHHIGIHHPENNLEDNESSTIHMVNANGAFADTDEAIAVLRRRTERVPLRSGNLEVAV